VLKSFYQKYNGILIGNGIVKLHRIDYYVEIAVSGLDGGKNIPMQNLHGSNIC
jgi:hypothetical protein